MQRGLRRNRGGRQVGQRPGCAPEYATGGRKACRWCACRRNGFSRDRRCRDRSELQPAGDEHRGEMMRERDMPAHRPFQLYLLGEMRPAPVVTEALRMLGATETDMKNARRDLRARGLEAPVPPT